MALSNAERQRRYRQKKAGEQNRIKSNKFQSITVFASKDVLQIYNGLLQKYKKSHRSEALVFSDAVRLLEKFGYEGALQLAEGAGDRHKFEK